MATTPPPIPTLLLEKLAAGELSAQQRQNLMARYALSSEELDHEIMRLRARHAEILEVYPARDFVKAVENQLDDPSASTATSNRPPFRAAWFALPATLAAAAAAWVVLVPETTTTTSSPTFTHPPPDHILLKGERPDALRIWRAAQPENQRLEPGDLVTQGDTIQLQYFSPHASSGAIFSIDGRGVVTLHHPENAQSAALLEQGTHSLPYSYTLDDAPSYERFIMVTCDHGIDAATLVEHAKDFARTARPDARRAAFELPDGHDCTSHSVWLAKEAR